MAGVMVTFGSGGHSSEMLMMMKISGILPKLDDKSIKKLICVISNDDEIIEAKISDLIGEKKKTFTEIIRLVRPRNVGRSLVASILTVFISLYNSLKIVARHRPNLCVTNGPGISVIIALALRTLQLITLGRNFNCDILYVESFCRTRSLSLSGKIIYHLRLATEFYVQWPVLADIYPRTKYKGIMV